jgi:hypothetical protein
MTSKIYLSMCLSIVVGWCLLQVGVIDRPRQSSNSSSTNCPAAPFATTDKPTATTIHVLMHLKCFSRSSFICLTAPPLAVQHATAAAASSGELPGTHDAASDAMVDWVKQHGGQVSLRLPLQPSATGACSAVTGWHLLVCVSSLLQCG